MERTFSTDEVCQASTLSYRQVDYWCRVGVLTPEHDCYGSGSRRRWSLQNVAVIRVLAALRPFTSDLTALRKVAGLLEEWPFEEWATGLVIDQAGNAWLAGDEGAPAVGIHVNLACWKIPAPVSS